MTAARKNSKLSRFILSSDGTRSTAGPPGVDFKLAAATGETRTRAIALQGAPRARPGCGPRERPRRPGRSASCHGSLAAASAPPTIYLHHAQFYHAHADRMRLRARSDCMCLCLRDATLGERHAVPLAKNTCHAQRAVVSASARRKTGKTVSVRMRGGQRPREPPLPLLLIGDLIRPSLLLLPLFLRAASFLTSICCAASFLLRRLLSFTLPARPLPQCRLPTTPLASSSSAAVRVTISVRAPLYHFHQRFSSSSMLAILHGAPLSPLYPPPVPSPG